MIERREYADGTYTEQEQPWGFFRGGAAKCADGKVRRLKRVATTADTFFSVPASVRASGKTVAGYITIECRSGSSVVTDDDPAVVRFRAYTYRKNHALVGGEAHDDERIA